MTVINNYNATKVTGAASDAGERDLRSEDVAGIAADSVRPVPGWWEDAIDEVLELMRLPTNWDSYGALAPTPAASSDALHILFDVVRPDVPKPSIVPTRRRTIQFEWHEGSIDLVVEVRSFRRLVVSFENATTSEQWERDLSDNLIPLNRAIGHLIRRNKQ